jgi:hypothetical protein
VDQRHVLRALLADDADQPPVRDIILDEVEHNSALPRPVPAQAVKQARQDRHPGLFAVFRQHARLILLLQASQFQIHPAGVPDGTEGIRHQISEILRKLRRRLLLDLLQSAGLQIRDPVAARVAVLSVTIVVKSPAFREQPALRIRVEILAIGSTTCSPALRILRRRTRRTRQILIALPVTSTEMPS